MARGLVAERVVGRARRGGEAVGLRLGGAEPADGARSRNKHLQGQGASKRFLTDEKECEGLDVAVVVGLDVHLLLLAILSMHQANKRVTLEGLANNVEAGDLLRGGA